MMSATSCTASTNPAPSRYVHDCGNVNAWEDMYVPSEQSSCVTACTPSQATFPVLLQVFDLGAKGTDPASKVAEINDFYQVQ